MTNEELGVEIAKVRAVAETAEVSNATLFEGIKEVVKTLDELLARVQLLEKNYERDS